MSIFVRILFAAAISTGFGLSNHSAFAQDTKSAKVCNDELKANRGDLEKAGVTIREFIQSCWNAAPGEKTPILIARIDAKPRRNNAPVATAAARVPAEQPALTAGPAPDRSRLLSIAWKPYSSDRSVWVAPYLFDRIALTEKPERVQQPLQASMAPHDAVHQTRQRREIVAAKSGSLHLARHLARLRSRLASKRYALSHRSTTSRTIKTASSRYVAGHRHKLATGCGADPKWSGHRSGLCGISKAASLKSTRAHVMKTAGRSGAHHGRHVAKLKSASAHFARAATRRPHRIGTASRRVKFSSLQKQRGFQKS